MKKVCLWKRNVLLSLGLLLASSERFTVYAFPEGSPAGIFMGMGNVSDDDVESSRSESDSEEEALQSGDLQGSSTLSVLRELQRASINNRRSARYRLGCQTQI